MSLIFLVSNQGQETMYIRYFAVRDSVGRYLGCVGVDQDVTDIQKLEEEKRLLEP